MPIRQRRRLRLFWPYCHHSGTWHYPPAPFGPPPWWGPGRTAQAEKEMLSEYIEGLKEELEAAEEYLKELEQSTKSGQK